MKEKINKILWDFAQSKLTHDKATQQVLDLFAVSGSALPNGWMDWNKLTLDEMVEYLRNKYMFSSSGDAKCIYHLIEFYDNHK